MAEDSDLERTEEPTGRRIDQAREQGQVPHSKELGSFLVLVVAGGIFWFMGGWFVQRSLAIFRNGLTIESRYSHEPALMLVRLGEVAGDFLLVFSPLLAALILASLLPPFFLNAWVFAPKSLVPDLSRLNVIAGIGRMFSWTSLMELGKAILKTVLLGGVGAMLIWGERDEIFGLLAQPLESGLVHGGQLLSYSFLIMAATMILVVAADVPFQLWQYFDKLKMTKEEVKQEMKEMQGNPEVKGKIRSLQIQAARRRMMAAVPQADVIVTNPTHFAVALSYKSGMAAPKVIAKGIGEVAQRIKEIGAEHRVPFVEAPPLARSLYKHGDLDAEIPAALYTAVAEILAYVYQLTRWRREGGGYPTPPRDVDVPAELAVPEVA